MKRIAVLAVLAVTMMMSLMVGCTDGELTEQEVEQLVMDVLAANADIDTVKFDINTVSVMEMIGGPEPGTTTMQGDGAGAVDSSNRRLQIIMNMAIDIPGQGTQDMPIESYLVDGWMHMKVTVQEQGAQWMKLQMPEEMWDEQSELSQQISLLKQADEVTYFGREDIRGISCYVVEVVPSKEALTAMLSQVELPVMDGVDMPELDFMELIKEMSFKQWIAVDSNLILQSATHLIMEIQPADLGAPENEFEKITADQSTTATFYGFNEPVSIELPADAPKD